VRSAFVVTEHGTGISKGVGYVTFAAKEDVDSVLKEVNEKDLMVQGRKLGVVLAENKVRVLSLLVESTNLSWNTISEKRQEGKGRRDQARGWGSAERQTSQSLSAFWFQGSRRHPYRGRIRTSYRNRFEDTLEESSQAGGR